MSRVSCLLDAELSLMRVEATYYLFAMMWFSLDNTTLDVSRARSGRVCLCSWAVIFTSPEVRSICATDLIVQMVSGTQRRMQIFE